MVSLNVFEVSIFWSIFFGLFSLNLSFQNQTEIIMKTTMRMANGTIMVVSKMFVLIEARLAVDVSVLFFNMGTWLKKNIQN